VLALTTFPMLRSFPFLGVGLGAYGDIYGHYQPAVLEPGKIDVGYAHNDLLQLLVELGILGTVPVLLMIWRLSKDLLGAHLLGRTSCPVGGGEQEGARRHDPFSVGIAVGAGAVWVTNQLGDSVSRIDPATNRVVETITVGRGPVGIAVGLGAVWVANSLDGTVSRIDPRANEVVDTTKIGGAPGYVTVGPGAVWVTAHAQ